MKSPTIRRSILYGLILCLGILAGAMIQKTIGMGNILRTIGIPYPTSGPPPASSNLSVVDIPPEYRGKISLFILAGQSNMVGWAPVPEGEDTHPRIFVFGNDYHWRIAREPLDSPSNQVDSVSLDRIAFFGPGLAFARTSLELHPQVVIGLIPCAKNSSSISQWQRDLSDQSLYGSCLKRARAASPMGKISGILFFQGESDAVDPILYPDPPPRPYEWSELFITFMTDFRNDLNEPELPIVFAQLGSSSTPEEFAYWDVVKEEQSSVDLSMIAMITTDDLATMDGLHFTTESYRTIGERFARAYWNLVRSSGAKE